MQHRARIAGHLTGAVEDGEFTPVYEPLIELSTGTTQGYEMLARWHSPVLGHVSPEIFIPLIEEAGLIATMTDQLLRRAMQDATDWPAHVTLSVNVSPVQLRDPWFAQKMLRLIAETGFPGSRLIIEITENALVDNVAMARTTFESLRNQGVRIALDDFGTGYSSIARLRELPFDSVKIDREFIGRMSTDSTAAQITEAVLQLSQSLGLPVVAEGVENAEVADRLAALNCTIGQGRLYGQSMTAAEVRSLYHPPAAGRAVN
ncbi:MAG: EAL domain-containing protein [Sphingomonadales bacterium]|nr:EAL domain-containing protein [Sphingomonadales bacterium]